MGRISGVIVPICLAALLLVVAALPLLFTSPSRASGPPYQQPRVEVVATGLDVPWALAFAPDGRLFFTERPGRLRVMVGRQLQAVSVAILPVYARIESGLLGLALDPQFAQNHYLYVMYTYEGEGGNCSTGSPA